MLLLILLLIAVVVATVVASTALCTSFCDCCVVAALGRAVLLKFLHGCSVDVPATVRTLNDGDVGSDNDHGDDDDGGRRR